MSSDNSLTYTGSLVRQYDKDRFLTALFAPKTVREDLLAVYAFNVEIARIPETVSEPMIGQMRLQWWRDQITEIIDGKGPSKGHPVGEPLAAVIDTASLPSAGFFELLNAREQDLSGESPASMDDVVRYAQGTSATLAQLGAATLGARDETTQKVVGEIGTAWALLGIARSVRHRALSGQLCMLPSDEMQEAGLTDQDLQKPDRAGLASGMLEDICSRSLGHLDQSRMCANEVDMRALPVLLQATLATSYLKTLKRSEYKIYDPKVMASLPAVARLWWNAWRKRY